MKKNNFDQSSSGENIEFSARYSIDLASMFYDDFQRENTVLRFGRDNALIILGDCEVPFYKKAELLKMSKQAIFDLCADYEIVYWYETPSKYLKANLIRYLLGITIKQFYERLVSDNGWHSIGENIPHSFYISRGYSQGDAVYIVALDDDLNEARREAINRILWDSPVSIYCQVNDQEFFEDDFLADTYEWDREKVAEKVRALPVSDYAKAFIIEALPDYPDYQ